MFASRMKKILKSPELLTFDDVIGYVNKEDNILCNYPDESSLSYTKMIELLEGLSNNYNDVDIKYTDIDIDKYIEQLWHRKKARTLTTLSDFRSVLYMLQTSYALNDDDNPFHVAKILLGDNYNIHLSQTLAIFYVLSQRYPGYKYEFENIKNYFLKSHTVYRQEKYTPYKRVIRFINSMERRIKKGMSKFTVSWVSGDISKTHGSFDSYDEAFESIRKWWNHNGFTPSYIRVIGDIEENGKVKIDYGLHESFYYVVEEEKEEEKMTNKYELTNDTIKLDGKVLHRIKSLRDFGLLKKGTLGGYVQSEDNLSQFGKSWVYAHAKVYDNALIKDNAAVVGNAEVHGDAVVGDNAHVFASDVYNSAVITGNADVSNSSVHDRAIIEGNARLNGASNIGGYTIIKNLTWAVRGLDLYSGGSIVNDMSEVGIYYLFDTTPYPFVYTKSDSLWHYDDFVGKAEELKEHAKKELAIKPGTEEWDKLEKTISFGQDMLSDR